MYKIKIDSRKVTNGDTFVAIKGHNVDGHDYIEQAIKNGATKIIAEHGNYEVETIITSNPEQYITDYLVKEYKPMLEDMQLVGMTGTNGKTTTCYLTYQMLNNLGIKAAYIGTIGLYTEKLVKELPNTTPNIVELYELLVECYEQGYKTVIMEVSSHALDLKRVAGLNFKVGAFSNLTQDHLDYHHTMEEYLKAKTKILDQTDTMIVNIDDEYGINFCKNNYQTLGFNKSNYQILSYENTKTGTNIKLNINNEEIEINTKLRGKFNVYNFITMIAIASVFKPLNEVIKLSESVNPPRGRCQIIPVKTGEAVVDYAHTPDAVLKVINAFTEHKVGKIITVVGCGGDRDPVKRPIMGKIASDYSDYVIFTSDNPRTEDPKLIMEDIIKGVEKDNYEIELDRKQAIHKALDKITNEDIVLILGKGHEDYQIIGREKIHLDDVEQVEIYNSKN